MSPQPNETTSEGRDDQSARLDELFRGAEKRHGTYDVKRLRLVGSKMEMKDDKGRGPLDVKGPPTPELWEKHLVGVRPLGISPLREDGLCRWGVIDIDVYRGLDHGELARAGLPLVVGRSKSGGAHLYLFASDWVAQATMNAALVALAARLGHADAETFPPAAGPGNWINMPFWASTERCGVKAGGLEMTVAEFIDAAETARCSMADLARFANSPELGKASTAATGANSDRAARKLKDYVAEIAEEPEGGRGNLLFGRAKDMGKMIGAGWIDEDAVFDALMEAATRARLPYGEAVGHVRNGIKDGKREPPDVSDDDGDRVYPDIESIVRITGGEETLWRVTVRGRGTVKLTTRELDRYDLFTQRCMETLMVKFQLLKTAEWAKRIQAALLTATTEVMPEEETVDYRFRMALQDFCFDRHMANTPEEMAKFGKPWHDDDNDRIYFRFDALYKHLCELPGAPFRGCKNNKLGEMLKAVGRYNEDYCISTMPIGKCKAAVKVRWVRKSLFDEIVAVPPRRPPAQPPI